jgi:transcriptional regulator with XRE-family HTH domain
MTDAELTQIFASRLSAYRKDKGLSLSELARRCDMDKSCLCRYEAGVHMPRLKTVIALANFLSIHPFMFFKPWPRRLR